MREVLVRFNVVTSGDAPDLADFNDFAGLGVCFLLLGINFISLSPCLYNSASNDSSVIKPLDSSSSSSEHFWLANL
jgi:hypothetical protein